MAKSISKSWVSKRLWAKVLCFIIRNSVILYSRQNYRTFIYICQRGAYSLLKTTISRSLACLPDRKYVILTSHVVALFEDIWRNRQPPLYMYIQYSYCQACWFCLWLAVGVARHVDSASDWLWVWPYHAIQRGKSRYGMKINSISCHLSGYYL